MENKIDATLSVADRDKILQFIRDIRALLPFLVDLSPENRHSLVKMGDKSRAFVEGCLTLAESDDSFLPRSFEKTEMRQDKDLFDAMSPIAVEISKLAEALQDTILLTGSDLIMNSFEVYGNAQKNGRGADLDNLVPLLGRRFSRKSKKGDNDGGNGNNTPPA